MFLVYYINNNKKDIIDIKILWTIKYHLCSFFGCPDVVVCQCASILVVYTCSCFVEFDVASGHWHILAYILISKLIVLYSINM